MTVLALAGGYGIHRWAGAPRRVAAELAYRAWRQARRRRLRAWWLRELLTPTRRAVAW